MNMYAEKLFWKDPYLSEAKAVVTEVDGNIVRLDKTIFFAFSGGQESDSGTIGGHRVLLAEKKGLKIYYTVDGNHGLEKGMPVKILIDWTRRYSLMRLHFAAELILELVYRNLDHPEKIGAHIAEDKARLDFIMENNISSSFPLLEREARILIDADLAVLSDFSNREREERFWEIEGFAKIPCGGTHIRRTSEVGKISLKRKNTGHKKERIEIYLA